MTHEQLDLALSALRKLLDHVNATTGEEESFKLREAIAVLRRQIIIERMKADNARQE